MNAHRANWFPLRTTTFCRTILFYFAGQFSKPHRLPSVSSESSSSQEIVIASSRTTQRTSQIAFAIASTVAAVAWTSAAFASQGPGVHPGTASRFTQLAMAIIVYGISALVIGAGLIGAVRRH
jgi:hypothetical protein